jgi:hypothetical protein
MKLIMKHNFSKNKHQSNVIRKKYKNKKNSNKQFANTENSVLTKKKNITKNIYNKETINETIQQLDYYFTKDFSLYQNEPECICHGISNCPNETKQDYGDYCVINIKQYIEKMLKDKLLATYEVV